MAATPASAARGALDGVRVVDLTDERAIYGAKLIADLGADVVRPEPPNGDPLRRRGPRLQAERGDAGASLWHAFFASSRRFFAVDAETPVGAGQLDRLLDRADILLACNDAFAVTEERLSGALERNSKLVAVEVSSFGQTGPWRHYQAPDLVAGALGGAVATTGDAGTPPLKTFGELNFMLCGAYTAIAALAALHHAKETGVGQRVRVSVHECIASCLEQVFMWYWYQDQLANATGPVLERRGSLHWTNAYEVMAAQNGAVMVTPVPDLDAQIVWLLEQGFGEELLDPALQRPENRRALVMKLMDALRRWVATQDAAGLFLDAQARHLPYGQVQGINRVATNPHLEARRWWTAHPVSSTSAVQGPGAPYHFSETPWALTNPRDVDADGDAAALLAEVGWEAPA